MNNIYTIGHSNDTLERFMWLLVMNGVTSVVDVRSRPYSRYVPHFNREPLKQALEGTGMVYRYAGHMLGGRPEDQNLWSEGRPDYVRMAADPAYRRGIARLLELAENETICLLCSEENPEKCHRQCLIAQSLLAQGAAVWHIRRHGAPEEAAYRPPAVRSRQRKPA